MNMPPEQPNTCAIIAHRGASGYAPENTLAAFQKALELGADMIECDIHATQDGELVVIHDETIDRTTNDTGYVKDYTLSELKQFEIFYRNDAFRNERIPTLREVIALTKGQAKLVIEVKTCPVFYPGIEKKLVNMIEREQLVAESLVIAFYHPTLREINRLNPAIQTGILYVGGLVEPWAAADAVGATALHPQYEYAQPDMIAEARRRGYRVHPWTIDRPEDLRQWLDYGVDGITTDFPDRLAALLREHR